VTTVAILALTIAVCASSAQAQAIDDWLNAEAWDVEFEVTYKSSTKGTLKSEAVSAVGSFTYTLDVEQSFSGKVPLDLRSPGASLSLTRLALAGGTPDPEATTNLIMKTDQMSSWMQGGPAFDDDGTADEQVAAMTAHLNALKGPGKVQYVRVDVGKGLVNEMGSKYDVTIRETRIGSGKVGPGSESIMFEIDAETGKYLLSLPYAFRDDSMTSLQHKTVTQSTMDGVVSTDSTMRQTSMDYGIGRLVIEEPGLPVGQMPYLEGPVDPAAGKIVGERTIKASFVDRIENVPGTLTIRYTVTPRL
jgi:hypothetical protein